ncbi:MAG: hypothetical protein IPQ08_10370 [Chitinophagaceae bacterium]|nr:hypothetical protein [Chitinophagaceae bacterium]
MNRLLVALLLLLSHPVLSQNWKLEKDKDNIKVYTADSKNNSFKLVKVEATIPGTYAKLISVLTNVDEFSKWIYHNKFCRLIKKITAYDFIYYSEIEMPWPVSNRDVLIHLQIKTDSLPHFMTVTGRAEKGIIPEIPTKVRVPLYIANWKVTAPAPNKLQISYTLELDPGGSLPAWVVNSFAEKGPFGTFSNLAKLLSGAR